MLDLINMPGMFYDNNDPNVEDGEPGQVSILDDEILCITSPSGIEVRFTLYDIEYLYDVALERIDDIVLVEIPIERSVQ